MDIFSIILKNNIHKALRIISMRRYVHAYTCNKYMLPTPIISLRVYLRMRRHADVLFWRPLTLIDRIAKNRHSRPRCAKWYIYIYERLKIKRKENWNTPTYTHIIRGGSLVIMKSNERSRVADIFDVSINYNEFWHMEC